MAGSIISTYTEREGYGEVEFLISRYPGSRKNTLFFFSQGITSSDLLLTI